jgi:hypothetical protein
MVVTISNSLRRFRPIRSPSRRLRDVRCVIVGHSQHEATHANELPRLDKKLALISHKKVANRVDAL